MFYSIDCYKGNGEGKPYPRDNISFIDENLNELINKFILAHKYFDFTKWKTCYFIKWYYKGSGEHEPSEPIPIKFKYRRIDIEGVGIYEI